MNIPRHIFKSYDIRGLLEEVTPEIAELVGAAVVDLTGAKTVVIGRDMRPTSQALQDAVVRGVMARGAEVKLLGLVTSSLFNFAVNHLGVDAGIMVTASHNPSEYNGLKCVKREAMPISGHEVFDGLPESIDVNGVDLSGAEEINLIDTYLDRCIELADLPDISGVKIGVDYGNGMGAVTLQPLLKRLGIEATELYAEPNADFPNHEANPAKSDTLKDLQSLVVDASLDFGIATDGDADRIGFIDNAGRILLGDQTLAILARKKSREEENLIVTGTANIGWTLDKELKKLGAERITCKIGWSNVVTMMRENGSVLGGEVSSHFFYKETNFRESVDYTFLLVLGEYVRSGGKFEAMTEDLRTFYNSGEVNLEVEDKDGVLQSLYDHYKDLATEYDDLDGHRFVFGNDWWFIIRPSNTEPILRLTVEAISKEVLNKKIAEIKNVIE